MVRVLTISADVRELAGGRDVFEVEAETVAGLISRLEAQFPGLGHLIEEKMALAIDGEIFQDAPGERLRPECEVVLIPRIAGG